MKIKKLLGKIRNKLFNILGIDNLIETYVNKRTSLLFQKFYSMSVRPNINYLEIHLCEHCNLKCAHCAHFSSIAEEEYLSIEEFESDLKRLKELTYGEINEIHLMGGEPLLHPQCKDFFQIARKYFENSKIILITNAILLEQQDDAFYNEVAKHSIVISPTKYPIKVNWEEIRKKCKHFGIKLEFYSNSEKEEKTLYKLPLDLEGAQNAQENFLTCPFSNECVQLHKGKLYTCCVIPYIRHFNKKFNQNIQITPNDYIDIYKARNMQEIMYFLAKPVPFCKYCYVKKRTVDIAHRITEQKIEEWT